MLTLIRRGWYTMSVLSTTRHRYHFLTAKKQHLYFARIDNCLKTICGFEFEFPENPNVKTTYLQTFPKYSVEIGHAIGHFRYQICTDLERFANFLKTENPDNQLIIRVLKTFSRGGSMADPIANI